MTNFLFKPVFFSMSIKFVKNKKMRSIRQANIKLFFLFRENEDFGFKYFQKAGQSEHIASLIEVLLEYNNPHLGWCSAGQQGVSRRNTRGEN